MAVELETITELEDKNYLALLVEARSMLDVFLAEVKKDKRVKPGASKGPLTIIAEELGVGVEFVMRHTEGFIDESIFVDNEFGVWEDEKGEQYVNSRYLMRKLSLGDAWINQLIRRGNVPYVLLWTNVKVNRPQMFYKLDDIRRLVPIIDEKLDDLEEMKGLPVGSLIRDLIKERPPKLLKSHYKVLCAMIMWMNDLGFWPSNSQLAKSFYKDDFSETSVKSVIRGLKDKGYISVVYANGGKNTKKKDVVVHWGPDRLITREYYRNGKFVKFDRPYVKRSLGIKRG